MSGDIEDFLRRAAERRQARQANQPSASQAPAAGPEYSDARRERAPQARDEDDDEVVVAQVVEEPLARKLAELKRAQASAQAMRDAAAQVEPQSSAAADSSPPGIAANSRQRPARVSILSPSRSTMTLSATSQAPGPDLQNIALGDLQEALRTPQGLRSAILLHEILARPEHRW